MIASTLSSRCLPRGLPRNTRFLSIQNSTPYAPRKIRRPLPASSAISIRRFAAKNESAAASNTSTTATATTASSATTASAAEVELTPMAGPTMSGLLSAAKSGPSEGGTAGKIFFSSLCVLTFGLGCWQAKRLLEKVEMVKKREDDLKLDPLSGFDDWQTSSTNNKEDEKAGTNAKSYRRVHLQGKFQHDKEILIGPRGPPPGALSESGPNSGRGGGGGMSSSAQGYWVVTPFVVMDGEDAPTVPTTTGSQVEDTVKPKRGWFGRRGGEASKPSERNGIDSNLDTEREQEPSDTTNEQTIVWINRGWIPRQFIDRNNEISTPWHRPQGIVPLMAMESSTEKGGTFAPPSRLDSKKPNDNTQSTTVNKLLWVDREAMGELMSSGTDDSSPPFFVEINTNEANNVPPQFPVKPRKELVGEFKVMPEVHAGYALTWFGLSGAGMVMTRKLLRRGR